MKQSNVINHWKLRQAASGDLDLLMAGKTAPDGDWLDAENGLMVHEALYKAHRLPDEIFVGKVKACEWICKEDWIYTASFCADTKAAKTLLYFGGVDTVADIFLNGKHLAFTDDMFMPLTLEITPEEQNNLTVYFHSPTRVVEERLAKLAPDIREKMGNLSVIRKDQHDFGDFGGVTMTPVGLFEDVQVISLYSGAISYAGVRQVYHPWLTKAQLQLQLEGTSFCDGLTLRAKLFDPEGKLTVQSETAVTARNYCEAVTLDVENPRLWWPKNYGDHPLYSLEVTLEGANGIIDSVKKTIGFRKLEKTGDMRFRVNDVEIKLWGGNMAGIDGRTHRWSEERGKELMLRLANSNMNILRMWGGTMSYGDSFYEACDREGIMLYQDFHLGWSYYDCNAHQRSQFYEEARYTVRRLKHHPCILLWSGGNETWMHHEENEFERYDISYEPFLIDQAKACQEEDPDRYYLPSSPCGGDYPSDPSEGVGHPLQYSFRHSVEQYPVFVAETARTSFGPLRSIRKFMSDEEIWPEGYVDQVTYQTYNPDRENYFKVPKKFFVPYWKMVPVPQTWAPFKAAFFAGESAHIERFYDAHDAESLVYRYNAAFADFMRTYSERVRCGKPYFDTQSKRQCQGYMLWKINDAWPQFHCSTIDFFLETYIPYYQVKRSYAPVLLSFDYQDHILLWGVNDTAKEIRGSLRVLTFSLAENKIRDEMNIPVRIKAGESKVLTNLDELCPITREWMLYACLTDEDGREITRKDTYVELERYMTFPEATISARVEGDTLVITTDKVAHVLEIGGGADGQDMGWLFEDNYFNLLPFEEKRVRILRKGEANQIHLKAHYSPNETVIEYQ